MAELTRIHSSESTDAINVVFVHGLGGDALQTWMYDAADDSTLWPRWVGEDANCNVWVMGYDAALSAWKGEAMHLADQGMAFMSELLYESAFRDRPLVLVGHSLGGLVIKSGIVQAATLGDPNYEPLLDWIAGVVFVGTPHQGSNLATVADALIGVRPNPQVVNMTAHDAWLRTLNGQFRVLQATRQFRVAVFSETHPVFYGRKFLGFRFGIRVLIVDGDSSNPQIPQVTPTPIASDHIQIAKPANRKATIHKGLLDFLRRIVEEPPAQTGGDAPARADFQVLRENLHKASAPLLTWPRTLPDGSWLLRPELEQVVGSIDETASSLTLLLGDPGSGKSALLSRMAQVKEEQGWPVLAIKADRLPQDVLDLNTLSNYLGIGTDPVAAIRELAGVGPVLVIIDQLDALADLVVQHSARLRVLLDLIRDLADTPNVHIVASCRIFEQRHDPSLRNLEATPVTLQLPDWEAVQAVLDARGISAAGWNEELKQVLRSPHALDVFLGLLQVTTEAGVLTSFQGMLQLRWQSEILSDLSGRRKRAVLEIARLMAEREVLGLPLAAVEDWLPEIRALAAAGFLRFDEGAGRVEFRHQTLYEFIRARSFLDEAGSLTDAVLRNQTSLRIRPQLWHALAFFRKTSPEDYQAELDRLWSSDLRPHLRMLVIELIGRQDAPLPAEVALVSRSLDDLWFRPRFINACVGSPGWFDLLAGGYLPVWMVLPPNEARAVVPLLEGALGSDSLRVVELIRDLWLPDPAKDELSWRVLGLANVNPQSLVWVEVLETIALRTTLAEWAVDAAASALSATLPDQAPRLVRAWIHQRLQQARATNDQARDEVADPGDAVDDGIESLLEGRQFHSLPAIAEAAPKAFIEVTWPLLIEILEINARPDHDILVGFRQSRGLVLDEMDDDERMEKPLVEAMWRGVQGWASNDPAGFMDFVESNPSSQLLVAERLLAKGVEECVAAFPTRALAYIQGDLRRFALGPYSNVHKESVALIRAISPHLDDVQLTSLAGTILGWERYKATPGKEDAETRRQRLRWARQHRLRLLRGLPKERLTPELARQLEEEERAFPDLGDQDVYFSGAQWIGSPVTAGQMARSRDEDILNLFDELSDESAWDHPTDRMKGGAIQASRELGALAKTDREKVLRIVRELKPGTNEIPAGMVVRELGSSGFPAVELYALIEELEGRGFASEGFRQEAAFAVSAAMTPDCPVPDSLMDRLESWLTPTEREEEDDSASRRSDDSSVLWGGPSSRTLPGGNFPILGSLTEACLKNNPRQVDRWLGILERHVSRSESPQVWRAIQWRYLPKLSLANRSRAEAFLDSLFDAHPELLASSDGVRFLAESFRWVSAAKVQQWFERLEAAGRNDIGLGELAALRHAMFPAEGWARDAVAAALAGTEEAALMRRIGIAHAVAQLWPSPMLRPVVHPMLLQLVGSSDELVLRALSTIFRTGGFLPDEQTRETLDSLVSHPRILAQQNAEQVPEILESLVVYDPDRVCKVANAVLDVANEQMGNMATSWYLSTEPLLAVALRLQDLGARQRDEGSRLFERMLEFNLPQAQELTLDLDKRTPIKGGYRPIRRRRAARGARRRM